MAITDLIDKLDSLITNQRPISELKPHLASLREHAEALEGRIGTLESEAKDGDLKQLVASLQEELRAAQQEIASLQNNAKKRDSDRPKLQERILDLLAIQDDRPDTGEIANALSVNETDAEFHITELSSDGLITCADPDMHLGWYLSHEGRRYQNDRNA